MEIYFQLIRDAEGLKKACEELKQDEYLGFDTETTELDPFDGELRLVQFSNGRNTYVIDLRPFYVDGTLKNVPALAPLRDLLESKTPVKIAHNAKFDAKWVRHHIGCEIGGLYDTMLASQLIAAGDKDRRHGLADVALFFTGNELDKTQQVSDWSSDELSQLQVEYAAKDAAVMVPLREKVDEQLEKDGLKQVAQIEFECIMPIAEMELNGFYLDEPRWREQLDKVKVAQAKVADELQDMLSAGVAQASLFGRAEINLDSQAQVTDALKGLGIPVPDSTRDWVLEPLAAQYPQIAKLREYRAVAKSLSSFGENILEFINPQTHRIHADFRQIGAPTGRFACTNPNVQQIPHETAYRRCFTAPPGRKLVIADYSQIELRILADFSQDQNFIKAFESGADFHSTAAAQVFGVNPDEVTAEQRSFAKRLNFGVVYGIGASRFAMMTGLSQTEGENTLRRYFTTYSGLDGWLREASAKAVANRESRTVTNRLIKMRYDEADPSSIAATRRNGKNAPIQGTSADILKRALRLLHDSLRGTSAKLVNIVHDEIIVECDAAEAEQTAAKLEAAMRTAGEEFVKRVPVKVDVMIADEWAK